MNHVPAAAGRNTRSVVGGKRITSYELRITNLKIRALRYRVWKSISIGLPDSRDGAIYPDLSGCPCLFSVSGEQIKPVGERLAKGENL